MAVNGYVILPIYLLPAFFAATQNSTAPRESTPHQLTACALITKADVEEAIGIPVSNGDEDIQGTASTCDYSTHTGLVSISIQKLTNQPDLKAEIAAMKEEIPLGVVRAAPGFPVAFYLDIPDAGTQLHLVHEGSRHLMISILGFGDASQVSGVAAQLARKAITRFR